MPTISLPKFELPEVFRDMTTDDIAKAMPDVHVPKVDVDAIGKRAGKVFDDVAKNAGKAVDDVAKSAGKKVDDVAKNAGKMVDDVAKSVSSNVEQALPRRAGPSPIPFAVLGMLGGLIVGWLLATSPTTGPRINGFMDWLRGRIEDWRTSRMTDLEDDLEDATDELRRETADLGQPVMGEPDYVGAASTMHSGTAFADDQPWSSQPNDLRSQSLGAAAADEYVEQPTTGSGRMTDQLQIDETEGDAADLPHRDASTSTGLLTETMRIDDGDDADEVTPAPSDRF